MQEPGCPGRPFISSIVSTHPFTPFLLPLGGLSIPRTPPPKLSVLNLSQRRRRGRGRGRPPRWLRAPGSSVSRRKTQEGALGPALCTSGAATGRRYSLKPPLPCHPLFPPSLSGGSAIREQGCTFQEGWSGWNAGSHLQDFPARNLSPRLLFSPRSSPPSAPSSSIWEVSQGCPF